MIDVVWAVVTAPITVWLAPPVLAVVGWMGWHEHQQRNHPCEECR